MIALSFTNLAAGATIVGSTENENFPASYAAEPQSPFLPWRTTALGDQSLVIDFGAQTAVTLLLLIRTNFASATIQGNATDSWTSPAFSQAVTIARNPFNWRYQHGVVLSGFSYQYMRVLIPSQTPVDGAGAYILGGVWAGATVRPPMNPRADVVFETLQPFKDVGPDDDAWRERLYLGEPLVRMRMTRLARVTRLSPGLDDQLQQWSEIDRQMYAADRFAMFLDAGDPSQAYVVRGIHALTWDRRRLNVAEGRFELEESIR